jgi:hypothetical protein
MLMHLFVQAVGVDGFHLTGTVIGNLNRASFSKAQGKWHCIPQALNPAGRKLH